MEEMMKKIKLVCCDIDGTLTDGTVFYSSRGEELKQFSNRDGRAFHLIKEKTGGRAKVALITSEVGGINEARAAKFQSLGTISDYIQGAPTKKQAVLFLCQKYGIEFDEVLFIGDDTNDLEAMDICGLAACPYDALQEVKEKCIMISKQPGGRGAVREIVDRLLARDAFYGQEEEKKETSPEVKS
jgi:YrbI family 3-deoxy-D-manno-octulosonate 8-phosphate phosphatase